MKTQMNVEKLNSILFHLYVYECTSVTCDHKMLKEIKMVLDTVGFKYAVLKCISHYDGSVYWQINVEDKPSRLPTVYA